MAHATRLTLLFTLALLAISNTTTIHAAPNRDVPDNGDAAAEAIDLRPWNEAQIVLLGTLTRAQPGPVARSLPPIHTHRLSFDVEKVLRGDVAAAEGPIELHHSARQNEAPTFPLGDLCLVAASRSRGRLIASVVLSANEQNIKAVTAACQLPLGWSMQGTKPLSPWASLGDAAWNVAAGDASELKSELVCKKSGRPALLVGDGIAFAVEKVPPKEVIKWTNPDGDGEYKITLTNTTDEPVAIPALLSAGDKILWDECVLILCQNKVYPIPAAAGVSGPVTATTLAAGESISHVVNALSLSGPEWPKGGYRIEFRICLGEKSQTMSFYYRSKHHDAIRDASQK